MASTSEQENIQFFSFYIVGIDGNVSENFIKEFSKKFENFLATRDWAIDPPTLFPKEEDEDDDFIIGGELKIFNAWKNKISKEDDIKNYNDVKSIIDFLTGESSRYSAEIEFTIDRTDVGEISNGILSKSLSIALLKEWKKHLGL